MDYIPFIIGAGIVVILLLTIGGLLSRYRKCPSNEMLIVFGKTGSNKAAKCVHGGGCFVWPIIQDYAHLSTNPIQISTNAVDILSKQNINVSFPVNLTVAIDTASEEHRQAAASRLLGMEEKVLINLLKNNLLGGLRAVIATMTIEDIKDNRDAFFEAVAKAIKPSLDELGLKILDLNMEDLTDNDHYLENLSKRSVTAADAEAKASIAEMEKDGAIRVSIAEREKEIQVNQNRQEQAIKLAEIQRDQETKKAIISKDQATAIAQQNAERRAEVAKADAEAAKAEAQAQADQDTVTAEAAALAEANVAKSQAKSAALKAEADAERNTRMAQAQAKQEAETEKAIQEKEAAVAEFDSQKRQKKAEAMKKAGVAEQQATIEVSKAQGQAAQAAAEATRVKGTSEVEAQMAVEKTRQERQLEVNQAQAKAAEAKLNAEIIIPAQKAKEEATIHAEAKKNIAVIAADADAAAAVKKAEAEANAIKMVAEAEAEGNKKKLLAEADGKRASLMAETDAAIQKAEGLSKAEVAGVLQLGEALGDPQAAVQFFMRDVTEKIETAKAYSGSLHDIMGNVTVYGDTNAASNFASNLLGLVPQIKQLGTAVSEGVKTAKGVIATPAPENDTDFSEVTD